MIIKQINSLLFIIIFKIFKIYTSIYMPKILFQQFTCISIRLYRKLHTLVSSTNAWLGTVIFSKKACQSSSDSITTFWKKLYWYRNEERVISLKISQHDDTLKLSSCISLRTDLISHSTTFLHYVITYPRGTRPRRHGDTPFRRRTFRLRMSG